MDFRVTVFPPVLGPEITSATLFSFKARSFLMGSEIRVENSQVLELFLELFGLEKVIFVAK